MKITYEQLMFALDHGEVVLFKDHDDGDFIAIGGAGKDFCGDYRNSGLHITKEECLQCIGRFPGVSVFVLKEIVKTHEYIDSFAHAISDPIPKGAKVFIKENAKEECKLFNFLWNSEKENMIGKCLEIRNNSGHSYVIYNDAKDDYWVFPRTAFTVIVPKKERTLQDVFAELSEEDKEIIKKEMNKD